MEEFTVGPNRIIFKLLAELVFWQILSYYAWIATAATITVFTVSECIGKVPKSSTYPYSFLSINQLH